MAFGTSRIFTSADAGAPVVHGAVGSLITVLDAVLVNGYGSTPSLGWTKEFSGTNKAVYRASTGTRRYLRVDDSIGYNASISSYETMTNIDNGTDRMPSLSGSAINWYKSYYQDTAATRWYIIGDEAGFYFIPFILTSVYSVNTNSGYWWSLMYYAGDYNPYDIRNKWNFVLIGYYDYWRSALGLPHGLSATSIVARGSSFAKGYNTAGINGQSSAWFGQNASPTGFIGITGCKLNGCVFGTPVRLYDTNSISGQTSYLGIFPGLFDPAFYDPTQTTYNTAGFSSFPILDETDSNGLRTIMFLTGHTSSANPPDIYMYSGSSRLIIRVGKGFRNVQ